MTNTPTETPADSTPRTPKTPKSKSVEDLNKQSPKKKRNQSKKKSTNSEAEKRKGNKGEMSKPKWRAIELGSGAIPIHKIAGPMHKSEQQVDSKPKANKFPIFTVTQTQPRGDKKQTRAKTPPVADPNESDGEGEQEKHKKDDVDPKDANQMPDNVQKLIEALLPNNALQPGLLGAMPSNEGQQVQQAGNVKVIYINQSKPRSELVPQIPPAQPQNQAPVPEEQYVNLNPPAAPAQDEQYANLAPPPKPLPSIQVPQKGNSGSQPDVAGSNPGSKPSSKPPSPHAKKHGK